MSAGRSHDWAWRRRIRAHPGSRRVYRVLVATLGVGVVVVGLALVPLPGPGWLVVFLGLGLLASEFTWAHRLHRYGLMRLRGWEAWVRAASAVVRLTLLVVSAVTLTALTWTVLRVAGVPAWTPSWLALPLRQYLGL